MTTPELDITAAVEAAAPDMEIAMSPDEYVHEFQERQARTAIEAALPHLLAQIGDGIAEAIEADAKQRFTTMTNVGDGFALYRQWPQAANIARTYGRAKP